jgi:fumarate reductase flavoprotein subunit
MAPYFVTTPRTIAQGGTGWAIFDERARRSGPPAGWRPRLGAPTWMPEAISAAAATGTIGSANSIQELAMKVEISASTLSATLAQYNSDCEHGEDTEYLKESLSMVSFDTPPFYVIPIRPVGANVTGFGLKIDRDARVLAASDHHPIPGLYAAGEVTGNVLGPQYLGGGNAVTSAVLFGRVAGQTAASELP